MLNQNKVDQAVSLVGNQGCTRIRELIVILESGAAIPETSELDQAESQAVLTELKSIMAIYDLRK